MATTGGSGPDRDHAGEIERAFTAQADAFEDPARNRVFTTDASWAIDRIHAAPDDLALDVAAGTGLAARRLAGRVRAVVALDATEAMLARGQAQARADGVRNVVYILGDAQALPFLPASFDIVLCRFAVHHFGDPAAVVAELARVTRPGGRVSLIDLIAHDDPAVAAEQNRLEILRDRSHIRMLPAAELAGLLDGAGLTGADTESRPITRPLQPWLAQADPPAAAADEIRARLRAESAGDGPETGFTPQLRDGALWFTQTFCSCVGVREA